MFDQNFQSGAISAKNQRGFRFAAQADTATPDNKTQVLQLDSDHSPFLSMPQQLIRALLSLA
ncbi:hypothetical protein [Variovorax paradoxus]|uniref:hypothetical protein n=1 Tax=Variovorax paradoxus TaxID=34073 RepID=UPI0029C9962E|nr:hypothetical protein [Variovorax paradoxus]WPH24117.1 hypothetical protein RZE78_28065 [Variovorax paradoxus]